MMKTAAGCLLLCAASFGLGYAQSNFVTIKDGILKGNDFVAFPEVEQRRYASGLIDGMLLAPLFQAPKASMAWMESCVLNMTDKQLAAILAKHLEAHPEAWHQSAHVPMFAALKERCPKAEP